ncbi:MAG: hypothetical protein ACREMK_06505 [Gemmatimonadota bacterium]
MRPYTNRAPGRLASVLLAIAALAIAHPAAPLQAQGGALAEAFPLQRGNSWTYDGTVWWVPHNSRRVLEERVTLEMEVVEVAEWGRMRGAVLRGFPGDLVTSAPDRFTGEFTLFQTGSTVHLLRGEAGREAIRRLRERDASVADLVRDSEVVLDLPLTPGETFCSRGGTGGSARVCWFVEKEDPVEVLPVHGVRARGHRERYLLDLRSGAEHEVRGFVPGVGFTSFAIGHFGDPSALELELVEVHLVAPPGTFLKTLDLADEPAVEMATDSRSPEPESPGLSAADPARTARADLASPTVTTQATAEEPVADAAPARSAAAASPPDADGDGVPDEADGCAGSAAREIVDRRGCSLPPPERLVERREAPQAPVVHIALEEIPVPDYVEPACVDNRQWFLSGESIEFDGRPFDPIGTPEPISLDNLVQVGEYDGVPLYTGRNAREPHLDVWLPVCRSPNTFRLYADLTPGN